ncbi:hypothetical protein FB45DRAFT_44338 [Roridomyces roridus]|uniref:Uncharacterized protein n=1 Tax=Roridomyces roridus TaxID=1738132 RepID=A0AAD7BRP7_9AGAR|nr:hypothetical protein FB45DRAFT_44338 [Roridomyces roridus]
MLSRTSRTRVASARGLTQTVSASTSSIAPVKPPREPDASKDYVRVGPDLRTRVPSRGNFTADNSYGRSVQADPVRTSISTLDPAKVKRTDLLDLRGRYEHAVTFPGSEERRPVKLHYFMERLGKALQFPEGSRGFLYYDTETHSVRFRVRGARDLLLPDGSPWRISLRGIRGDDTKYGQLYEQIRRDDFIGSSFAVPLSTFNPDLLQPQDRIVIRSKTLRVWMGNAENTTISYERPGEFPFGSQGFLYYRAGSTPVGGSLRFRLAASLDGFAHGTDLPLPSGLPWSIPLAYMVSRVKYTSILDELLRTGLVTAEAVENLRRSLVKRLQLDRTLFELGQLFPVDFSSKMMNMTVVGADGTVGEFSLQKMFTSSKDDNSGVCAFTGAQRRLALSVDNSFSRHRSGAFRTLGNNAGTTGAALAHCEDYGSGQVRRPWIPSSGL